MSKVIMNVIGKEQFTVDTVTGVVTGTTYHAKEFLKDNFAAKWNKEEKFWTVDTKKFADELTRLANYYKKYIVEVIEEKAEVEETTEEIETVEEKEVTANEVVASKEVSAKEEATIISQRLVNSEKEEGYVLITIYSDGKTTRTFCG